MSRYIEIDTALLKTVATGGLSAKALWKRIMEQPSIDIVRCKDCQWFDGGKNDIAEWHFCKRHFGIYPNFDADDFCSYGERKDDEG